jgi:pimeloyl-ACP methyl ester carboxylesterase
MMVPVTAGMYFHLFQEGVVETPPVVLIHGVGGMHLFWPPPIRRLPGYRVYALDLPGHGKSNQGGGLQSVDAYAEHIVTWMEAVHLHRAIFVGHGMGAGIALALSTHYSERVLGLSLISSGVRFNIPHDLLADASGTATFHKAVENLVSCSFGPDVPENSVVFFAERLREVRPSVLYGDLLACDCFDYTEKLPDLRVPTLILSGDQDRITPLRYSQLMAQIIPDAVLQVVPKAGHMVMLEQPDMVAKYLMVFLTQIPYHAGEMNQYVPGD